MMGPTLSDAPRRVDTMRRYNPWRALHQSPDITLLWARLDGCLGLWHERSRTMILDPRQSQVERRCTLAYEAVRAERRHDGPQSEREDASVRLEAARKLIDIYDLGDKIVWAQDPAELADELFVDEATLLTRMQHLHPAEAGYLKARLAARDGVT